MLDSVLMCEHCLVITTQQVSRPIPCLWDKQRTNQKPRSSDSPLGRGIAPDVLLAHWTPAAKPMTLQPIGGVRRSGDARRVVFMVLPLRRFDGEHLAGLTHQSVKGTAQHLQQHGHPEVPGPSGGDIQPV